MGAALGQNVDPQIFEFERAIIEVELQILGKGRDVLIQRFDQVGKDRKPLTQNSSQQ